jgi:predicted RNase H-like nuclease (RuvC/YqgF family)
MSYAKKIGFYLSTLTLIFQAHADFGGSFAGGLTGGLAGGVIGSAISRPRQSEQQVVVREVRTAPAPTYQQPANQNSDARLRRKIAEQNDEIMELHEENRALKKKNRELHTRLNDINERLSTLEKTVKNP